MRNRLLACTCIFINLLVGNLALLLFPDLSLMHRILISCCVGFIYGITLFPLLRSARRYTTWKLIKVAAGLSLVGLLIACLFIAISMRSATDSLLVAALKGVLPMYPFALVFGSPFWISLAFINFIFLHFLNKTSR